MLNQLHRLRQLVNLPAASVGPVAPLIAVDWPQVAVFVRPFVPDADAGLLERFYVRLPTYEPQKFMNNRFDVELFRRQ